MAYEHNNAVTCEILDVEAYRAPFPRPGVPANDRTCDPLLAVRSETLGSILRRRLALAKFGMAGLFALLGSLVLITV